MKNLKSLSGRTLAVVLAVLMIMSAAVTGAYAALDFSITAENNGTAIVLKASNTAYTYEVTNKPTDAVVSVSGEKIILTTPAAGSYTFKATSGEESKTVDGTAEKVTITAAKDDKAKSITMSNSGNYNMTYFIKGSSNYNVNGNLLYNLKSGTAYNIVGYWFDAANSKLYFGETTSEKLKDGQAAPANLKAVADTNSITVEKITGAEYMLAKSETGELVKDWTDENVFTGLETGVFYTVSARMKATADKLASESTDIYVKTLQANTDAVKAVNFVSVTKTAITAEAFEGYEYSMDGKTWQTSSKFTGLTSGKDYTVYQRIAAKGEFAPSAPVKKAVTTNTADAYTASMTKVDDIKWATEDVRVGDNNVTIYGDIRTDGNIQWGDTRIVPTYFTDGDGFAAGAADIKATDKAGKTFRLTYKPGKTGEKKITVIYEEQEYKGTDGWVTLKSINKTYNVTVKHANDGFWGVLVNIIKVLFTTLPQYLSQAIVWLNEHGISFLIGI